MGGWIYFAVGMLIVIIVSIALSILSLKRSKAGELQRKAWAEERRKLNRRIENLERDTLQRENKDKDGG